MKRKIAVLFALLVCIYGFIKLEMHMNASPQYVSLMQLIVAPDDFDGERVLIAGFLHLKFENYALYLTQEHGAYLVDRNAIWVSIPSDSMVQCQTITKEENRDNIMVCDEKYVLIEGIFEAKETGHMGMFPGGITNVTRLVELDRYPAAPKSDVHSPQ